MFIDNWWHITEKESDAEMRWKYAKMIIEGSGYGHLLQNPRILEIGVGGGLQLRYFTRLGLQAVGIDYHIRDTARDLPVIRAHAESLPFPDRAFDIVYSCSVFDKDVYPHQNQKAMRREISRVLKAGGAWNAHEPCMTKYQEQIGDLVAMNEARAFETPFFVKKS